jgi:hypothetical protein
MKLKIGDKVKMTAEGYHFHHNVDKMIEGIQVPSRAGLDEKDVEERFCEMLAIQGIGTVIKFNSDGDPFISWEWKNAGMFFKKRCFYDIDDVRKLTLWEKLCALLN